MIIATLIFFIIRFSLKEKIALNRNGPTSLLYIQKEFQRRFPYATVATLKPCHPIYLCFLTLVGFGVFYFSPPPPFLLLVQLFLPFSRGICLITRFLVFDSNVESMCFYSKVNRQHKAQLKGE